jgi:glucosamine 6-phosphate synthetase-like amidotransferase/phosphosugar isomerase protein
VENYKILPYSLLKKEGVLYPYKERQCTLQSKRIERMKISKQGQEVSKTVSVVDWHIEDVQKCGYAHYMLKEIHEQPRVIDKPSMTILSLRRPP